MGKHNSKLKQINNQNIAETSEWAEELPQGSHKQTQSGKAISYAKSEIFGVSLRRLKGSQWLDSYIKSHLSC